MADSEFNARPMTEFEQQLRKLEPRAAGIDRERLMFQAGRASAATAGNSRVWRLATYAATTAALLLAGLLAMRPEPRVIREIVHVPVMPVAPEPEAERMPSPMPAPTNFAAGRDQPPAGAADRVHRQVDAEATTSYLALRHSLLTGDPNALPRRSLSGDEPHIPPTARELLDALLEAPET